MTASKVEATAPDGGTFHLADEFDVNRLGYGTIQLTGEGYWGPPRDEAEAIKVLRRAVELGVNFIDTADAYGPFYTEQLISKALKPYPDDLVIATKGGLTRPGPNEWPPVGRPEYLRQQVHLSLRHLAVDHIDLYQLHRVDPKVPVEDSLGELKSLQDEGKIRHIGLSEVRPHEIDQARSVVDVVSVQNLYNIADRSAEDVLGYAERERLAFIPWFPLGTGQLVAPDGVLAGLARSYGATAAQLALAWLLWRSPNMMPIPGTSRVSHLEENIGACGVHLRDEEFAALADAVNSQPQA